MRKLKKVGTDRRGLSSIFISLYLAILAILLLSMLFVALEISGSALTESIRVEQARMQEAIELIGPEALNLTENSIVHCLRVNNTGSITVRLRALYIGHKFMCDPSTFPGDSYIDPKEALWVQLYPNVNIVLNDSTIKAEWTVATERGTKASEIGGKLKWGEPGIPYSPKKFYIGPLMIVFDMFHWRSGSGPWRSGWTIPKGTKDVTWRILLVNVDDRDIIITDTSCFTLISNDNAPKDPLPWYIDPSLSQTTLKPGVFNFVCYTWNKPFSEQGHKRQAVTGMQESTTAINFLTFFGSFIEADGSSTPFGQTVPFEAVLVTTESMASKVQLTPEPHNIMNDGTSTSLLTALVTDGTGKPVADTWIDFYASTGRLSTSHNTTDANGVATVTLTSSTTRTAAYVTAICQGVEGTCKVVFTPATAINVDANPTSVVKGGGTSTVTVQLVDGNGTLVEQAGITINVEVSSWSGPGGKKPTLTYEAQTGDSVTVNTDTNGRATITFTARGAAGTAQITASSNGLTAGETVIDVTG